MARPDEVLQHTGYPVGSIPPIGAQVAPAEQCGTLFTASRRSLSGVCSAAPDSASPVATYCAGHPQPLPTIVDERIMRLAVVYGGGGAPELDLEVPVPELLNRSQASWDWHHVPNPWPTVLHLSPLELHTT
jgi:hypothetical protein